MNRARSVGVALGVVAVIILGVMWLVGRPSSDDPLDPRSHKPNGTSALVALLRELGASVDTNAGAPGAGTDVALVLRDRMSVRQRCDLAEWAEEGGTLVIADPDSSLAGGGRDCGGDIGDQPLVRNDWLSGSVEAGRCDVTAVDDPDIRSIELAGLAAMYDVGSGDQSCFGDGDVAFLTVAEVGRGHIVSLGGPDILTNESIDVADNAPVAAAVLAPQSDMAIAVIDPSAPAASGDESLIDLIPVPVKRGLVQLAVAFLLYVLWRSRRMGKPVGEPQPVKVAGSELVAAVGGLLERSKSPQHAADLLRADLRRELVRRLGLAPNVSPEVLAQVVAARSRLDEARLHAALFPGPVNDDRELLQVAQLIDIIRKEIFEHEHVGS